MMLKQGEFKERVKEKHNMSVKLIFVQLRPTKPFYILIALAHLRLVKPKKKYSTPES